MSNGNFIFVVVVGTGFILGLIAVVGLLIITNTSRRQRHRAELAEMHLMHVQELRAAEREATRHTLQEVGDELHDNVALLLMVVHMGINWGPDDLPSDPRMEPAREALAECISEVRRLGHTLNSDMWEKRTLEEALRDLAGRLDRTGKLAIHLVLKGRPMQLPGDVSTVLFRVCQEVVANSIKHSGADALTITLQSDPHVITLEDNGKGFDPTTVIINAGLSNIQRRCSLIGFEAEYRSAPSEGCVWLLRQRVPEAIVQVAFNGGRGLLTPP